MHFNEYKCTFLHYLRGLCNFLSVVFWLLIMFGFDKPWIATLTILSAVIHEIAHESCFLFFRGSFKLPRGRLGGFKLRAQIIMSYNEEICTLAAGPFANFAVAILLFIFGSSFEYASLFAFLNLMTGVTNLLPIKGYDGYGILSAAIFSFEAEQRFMKILDTVSTLLCALLSFLSLFLMQRIGEGFWIFGVFYVSLFSSLCGGQDSNL